MASGFALDSHATSLAGLLAPGDSGLERLQGRPRLVATGIVDVVSHCLRQVRRRPLELAEPLESHAAMVVELRPAAAEGDRLLEEGEREGVIAFAVVQPAQGVEVVGIAAGLKALGDRERLLEGFRVAASVVGNEGGIVVGGRVQVRLDLEQLLLGGDRLIIVLGERVGNGEVIQQVRRGRSMLQALLEQRDRLVRRALLMQDAPELPVVGDLIRIRANRAAQRVGSLLEPAFLDEDVALQTVCDCIIGALGNPPLQVVERALNVALSQE